MTKLVRVKNKENQDILFLVKGAPSRYIEGEEYVQVKRFETDKLNSYIKRSSIIFHWRE